MENGRLRGLLSRGLGGGGRRISARPTVRGWQLLVFGVVSLVAARLVGTTQLYQLGYALLLLVPGAGLLGFLLLRGLSYERRPRSGERLVAGRESALEVSLRNDSGRRSPSLQVLDRLPDERRFRARPVPSHSSVSVEAPVRFPRRGLYLLGPAELAGRDPFGLLRFTTRFAERDEVVVYPRTFELDGFPALGGGPEGGIGRVPRRGDEFAGLREYRHGDDRRHIHWKSVARTGELVVREFAEDAPRRFSVALDLRRAGVRHPEAEIEDSVSAAASVLRHLHEGGLTFRLLLNDEAASATPFGSDEDHYWAAMRLLATARADGAVPLAALLEGARRGGDALNEGLGEGVIAVSRGLGGAEEGAVEGLRRLRASGLPVVVVAVAAHTYRGPRGGEGRLRREAAFWGDLGSLEDSGILVRVLEGEGGVPAFAGGGEAGGRSVAEGVR